MNQFFVAVKIVFVDVTYDWCVTYKFSKILVLDSIRMIEIFWRKKSLKCELT